MLGDNGGRQDPPISFHSAFMDSRVGCVIDVAVLEYGVYLLVSERNDGSQSLVQVIIVKGSLVVGVDGCINFYLLLMSQIRNSS